MCDGAHTTICAMVLTRRGFVKFVHCTFITDVSTHVLKIVIKGNYAMTLPHQLLHSESSEKNCGCSVLQVTNSEIDAFAI